MTFMSLPMLNDGLSPGNFARLAQLVESYSGIHLPAEKKYMVEGRLRRRAQALALSSLDAYCDALFEQGLWGDELVSLIDAITTNKTEFFRERPHFRILGEQVLPEFVGAGPRRPLRFWSAACANGAEAYSAAMLMDDFAGDHPGLRFQIVATDICSAVLREAKMAVFDREMMAPVPADYQKRYVMFPVDSGDRTVRMKPSLRQAVSFGRVNLMDPSYPLAEKQDVIFCRNLLIYFTRDRQEMVLRRLCDHLNQGGYLFISHTENIMGMKLPVRQMAPSVFQRL
jgi:chemotaxis protein methyltransferase CheR